MVKQVLVVAAHSDDEALGCAGTIAKHIADGDKVNVIFMTDGVGSRESKEKDAQERQVAAQNAGEILGVTSSQYFNFPDNKMDSVPLLDVTRAVEETISELKPDVIYTHHVGDLNVDHQVTHKAVITACRPQPGFCVKEIYAFEILSSTEWQTPGLIPFIPNIFVDITDFIEIKRKVLVAYRKEMREPPHSRSEENSIKCSEVRGNSVGINYAEAFSLVRLIR
jgi:LmbE family N-acetylglucosaminyl deacetylase